MGQVDRGVDKSGRVEHRSPGGYPRAVRLRGAEERQRWVGVWVSSTSANHRSQSSQSAWYESAQPMRWNRNSSTAEGELGGPRAEPPPARAG